MWELVLNLRVCASHALLFVTVTEYLTYTKKLKLFRFIVSEDASVALLLGYGEGAHWQGGMGRVKLLSYW